MKVWAAQGKDGGGRRSQVKNAKMRRYEGKRTRENITRVSAHNTFVCQGFPSENIVINRKPSPHIGDEKTLNIGFLSRGKKKTLAAAVALAGRAEVVQAAVPACSGQQQQQQQHAAASCRSSKQQQAAEAVSSSKH